MTTAFSTSSLHQPPRGKPDDLAQQLEIGRLAVVFGILRVVAIEEGGREPLVPVANRMNRARGAHKLEDFARDTVHVNGERHAAEAHERNAQFLLAHGVRPQPG